MTYKQFKELVSKKYKGYPIHFRRNEVQYVALVSDCVTVYGSPYSDNVHIYIYIYWHGILVNAEA
jgi:hypothetical protein